MLKKLLATRSTRATATATAAIAVVALVLAGCGGGSSSTTASTTTTSTVLTVPLQTASANLVNDGFNASVSISGWYGNTSTAASGNATVSLQKAVATTLGSTSVLANVQGILGTLDVAGGGTVSLSSQTTLYESTSTYATLALADSSEYVVFPTYTLPSTVQAGDTGQLGTATAYTDSTLATRSGTIALSYAVEADTTSTLLVSFLYTYYDVNGVNTGSQQLTYQVDDSGDIAFVSLQVTVVATSVTTGYSITLE